MAQRCPHARHQNAAPAVSRAALLVDAQRLACTPGTRGQTRVNPPSVMRVFSSGSVRNLGPLRCVDVQEINSSARGDKGFCGGDGLSVGGHVAHRSGMAEIVLARRGN